MYDLVIVGGGIMGASIAYSASRAGAAVVVVEADALGRATTAGAGIISDYGLGDDHFSTAWMSLVTRSTAEYRRLFAELGAAAARESEFAEVGEIVVATTDDELAALARFEARLSADGAGAVPQFSRLSTSELRSHWPYRMADLVGTFVPGTARVDGNKLARVLLSRAIAAGAEVVAGRAVPVAAHPTSVEVGGRTLAGRSLVIAAGIWATSLAATLGSRVAIVPDRGQIVHLGGERAVDDSPVLKTFDGPYVIGFGAGRVVTGATHADAAGTEIHPTAGDQFDVLSAAFRVVPGLRGARIVETRVGFRPRSADGFPLIGELRDGVYLAGGLGSWGLTMAPLLGRVLAQQLLGERAEVDLSFLDPHRAFG